MIGEPNTSALHLVVSSFEICVLTVFNFAGSEDGRVHVWSTESGMKVAVLDGKHPGPINTLQFNPRFMTFASACTNMVRWSNTQNQLLRDKWERGCSLSRSSPVLSTDLLASVCWWLVMGASPRTTHCRHAVTVLDCLFSGTLETPWPDSMLKKNTFFIVLC